MTPSTRTKNAIKTGLAMSVALGMILAGAVCMLVLPIAQHPPLVESQIGKQVFVVNQENKVESRRVEVGRG